LTVFGDPIITGAFSPVLLFAWQPPTMAIVSIEMGTRNMGQSTIIDGDIQN